MNVHHYHFGKDGGAERFFVNLVRAFGKRGLEQSAVIRPGRIWRKDIEKLASIKESNFRNVSIDRFMLPISVAKCARREKPNALMAWAPRASQLMPAYTGCIKIARLGDYPTRLDYFKNIDVIVCNAPGIADRVRQLGWDRGIEVISNFTDTSRVTPIDRAVVGTPPGAQVVMSMGRFVRRKGFHTLIDAFAALPDFHLWLAGDGEEYGALKAQVADYGLADRVKFLGWLKDARPYLAASDVFVMPSIHEPLGNVILEAWAQGVPVISTRSEGPSWFMRDLDNGVMVDAEDPQGLAEGINILLSDESLAQRVRNGGNHTINTEFSESVVTSAYLALFHK